MDLIWRTGYWSALCCFAIVHPVHFANILRGIAKIWLLEYDGTAKEVSRVSLRRAVYVFSAYSITLFVLRVTYLFFEDFTLLLGSLWNHFGLVRILSVTVWSISFFISWRGIGTTVYIRCGNCLVIVLGWVPSSVYEATTSALNPWTSAAESTSVEALGIYMERGLLWVLGRPTFDHSGRTNYRQSDMKHVRLLRVERRIPLIGLRAR